MPIQHDNKLILSVNDLHAAEKSIQKKFFNRMQREAMAINAHDEYYVCARGTGKSEGLDARFIIRNIWTMPGSTGALISPSYAKAWGNTLPAICHALKEWGYIQGIHYYVGHKAPKSSNFKLPKREPLRDAWSNCFHFWNGTVMVILSFAQGMSANSMSLDWVIGPEAKFLNYDKIKSEVNPANRGNRQYFDDCPHHHSVMYTTDMPNSKSGRWILEKEKEMSNEHIRLIRSIYRDLKLTERLPEQTDYVKKKIKELRFDLDLARKYQPPVIPQKGKKREYTVFFGEYDIFDNLEVVGEDYIWQMYRDSPTLIWLTAFLNERLFKVPNGFYSALSDNHFYIPGDGRNRLSKFGSDWNKLVTAGCLQDSDLDFDKPLHIAFDSNSAISSCCIGQEIENEMRTLRSFFVKTPNKLQDLVQKVCDHYSPMLKKEIIFYYNHTFTWTTGTNAESYCDTVIRVLTENRWNETDVYIGQAPRHDWKHQQIDMALKGDPSFLMPRFNLFNNEYLKLAMEQAGVKQGKDGFEKDKSPEKLTDSADNPDELKTHITDAWDDLFIGMNLYQPSSLSSSSGGAYFLK